MTRQDPTASVTVTIQSKDWQLEGQVTVPTGPTQVGDLLPLARGLAEAVISATANIVVNGGEPISCKKGCGACCRYLVAIAEPEARRVRAVVAALPDERRAVVLARFAAARQRLEFAGLLDQLQHGDALNDTEYRALCQAYVEQQIPCPFLEDEACAIYEERPIACREYLVTSPPANCASTTTSEIRRVRMPLRVFNAVARWQVPASTYVFERWVPLILALEWAEAHPNDPPPQPGIELLRELLDHLTGKHPPEPEAQQPLAM
jgi:Fe-S-cluster containining protein